MLNYSTVYSLNVYILYNLLGTPHPLPGWAAASLFHPGPLKSSSEITLISEPQKSRQWGSQDPKTTQQNDSVAPKSEEIQLLDEKSKCYENHSIYNGFVTPGHPHWPRILNQMPLKNRCDSKLHFDTQICQKVEKRCSEATPKWDPLGTYRCGESL